MVHAPTTSLEHRVEFPRAMALSTMNNRIVPQLRGTTTRGSFYVVRNGFHGNKCMHFHRMQQQQDSSTMRTTHFLTICVVVAATRCQYWVGGIPGPMSGRGTILYTCPLVYPPTQKGPGTRQNPPTPIVDRQTPVKTLPSQNYCCQY